MLACRQNDVFADVYGECRDSIISFGAERTPCVRGPVGMAHCGMAEAEPCTDENVDDRCELAHKRLETFSDVYGECRDSERTPRVRDPVGMANCGTANAEAMHGRKC